jgi:protein gp37
MAENTKIEWTDHTFNPWTGCTKVSPGCDGCYAEAWAKRSGTVRWGVGEPRRRTTDANWRLPPKWNAQAEREGRRFRVFCASLADVFDNAVPDYWRADLYELIAATPHLDWLLLTKRIGNAAAMLPRYMGGDLVPNVWIGATVVNQEEADRDIPKLLAVPARVRFLSIEPMLGPVDLGQALAGGLELVRRGATIDWIIAGGESGPKARPAHPDWFRSLRDQCAAAGVPFMFKQWGEWAETSREPIHPEATRLPGNLCRIEAPGAPDRYSAVSVNGGRMRYRIERVGKKAAGRLLDGVQHDGFPEVR